MTPDIASSVEIVREVIARAAERSGRDPSSVTLVAVSKTTPIPRILEAIEAGITHLGENRVQEAEAKFAPHSQPSPDLVPRGGITLHMIGTLQRNKAREAVRFFDIVHSVDRPELAQALEHALAQEAPERRLPVLLQVNSTVEPTKSGVSPEALPDLAGAVVACSHLDLTGLMTIARLGADENELRLTFSLMRRLLEGLRPSFPTMQHLSMGMTDDYEIAIEEGATMVRIGRAIFGERV